MNHGKAADFVRLYASDLEEGCWMNEVADMLAEAPWVLNDGDWYNVEMALEYISGKVDEWRVRVRQRANGVKEVIA